MSKPASLLASEHSFFEDEQNKFETEQNINQFDYSKNSSNLEGIFDTLNKEIKCVVDNCKDLSYYSNSTSKISEQQQYNEQFLDSRYWCSLKNNNDNDYLNYKIEKNERKKKLNNESYKNGNNHKKDNDFEEKIIYINNEDEKNNFNDDFDEEDMEEKTLEKKNDEINEINSIKVNDNNLNNKNFDNIKNNNNQIMNNNNKNVIKSKTFSEQDERLVIANEKLNMNHTPNKINQSFFPCLYNNHQVHSFVSSYTNYPSTFSKGSFISTNNSSNNKYKKDDEHCSSEIEEEIHIINNNTNTNNEEMKNNNNLYNQGNKFGPHLNNYNKLTNNNINNINNINETTKLKNINNLNNITNFNINNNILYNRIPKMNLNMVYYIPVQQQTISTNSNYSKLFSNINNIVPENNNNTSNLKTNKTKENNNIQNNINNSGQQDNKINNNSSSEEKNNNKINNISIKNNNNNHWNNNSNYKNTLYRKNDNNNINSNINSNSVNNIQCNKGEKNFLNLDDIVSGKDNRTTVMIRNIPIKYTEETLIQDLCEFKGKYDCLYMPYDYEKKGNKGYAFINFVNPLHILYFHEKFDGTKWPLFESSKICELNSANFQGIYEIQKHSKNYKGYKKPLFYSEQNNNNEKIIIPSKYLAKIKKRFPNIKYHENKGKNIYIIDSFE